MRIPRNLHTGLIFKPIEREAGFHLLLSYIMIAIFILLVISIMVHDAEVCAAFVELFYLSVAHVH